MYLAGCLNDLGRPRVMGLIPEEAIRVLKRNSLNNNLHPTLAPGGKLWIT